MVGGVETAGLVLAALSLIIKGVVHYADGVRTIRKWWQCRRELESLARTLEVERVLFLGTCEKLLDEVVINDDLFVKLIENPGSPEWKDEQLDQKFKQHLGSKHSLYQSLIEDMNSAVKELVRQLEIDEQGKPVCAKDNEFKTRWKVVKFSVLSRGYAQALTKITENNIRLERLTDQDKELLPYRKRQKTSGPHFNKIRRHADHLHRGLARSWTCGCKANHYTTLRLDARIPGLWASNPKCVRQACEETTIAFALNFFFEPKTTKKNLPWSRQEAEIRVVHYEETIGQLSVPAPLRDDSTNSLGRELQGQQRPVNRSSGVTSKLIKVVESSSAITSKGKKAVKFADGPSTILAVPLSFSEGNMPTRVENLCLVMEENSAAGTYAKQCLGYLDQEDHHRLELYLTCLDRVPRHENSHSLADLLSQQNPDSASLIVAAGYLPLTRGERLGLALTVASSVLQLNDTPWLHHYWSKRDILVDMTNTKEIFERAFISTSFPSIASSDIPGCNLFRNPTLFCLGIVLIEIMLGRTLESMRTDEDSLNASGQFEIFTLLSTARRLLDMGTISSEAGPRYADIVSRCIWSDFSRPNASLNDDGFRRAVYDEVVAPLEADLRYFNGSVRWNIE